MTGVVLILSAVVAAFASQGDGIIRLKPREFRQLPSAVRRDLDRRNCTVPQFPRTSAPHNVLSGSFISNRSRDWAVLCSVNGISRILIYRGGGASRVDSLARRPDVSYLQDVGNGIMEFSRKIDIASSKRIAEYAKANGIPKPPPLDHDGIDDSFRDKASSMVYYYRGKWRDLQSGD